MTKYKYEELKALLNRVLEGKEKVLDNDHVNMYLKENFGINPQDKLDNINEFNMILIDIAYEALPLLKPFFFDEDSMKKIDLKYGIYYDMNDLLSNPTECIKSLINAIKITKFNRTINEVSKLGYEVNAVSQIIRATVESSLNGDTLEVVVEETLAVE